MDEAAAIVAHGGVIAYPTETLYGLGPMQTDRKGPQANYEIKGRDFNNPVPVIIGKPDDLYPLVTKVGHFWLKGSSGLLAGPPDHRSFQASVLFRHCLRQEPEK